jgi:DNA-binding response OmpR family regulator
MSAFTELRRRHYVRPAGDGFVLAFGLLGRWLVAQAPAGHDRPVGGRQENRNGIARLVLDENRRSAFVGDREVRLTQQEYPFLLRLAREPGTVIGRTALAAAVWPGAAEYEGGSDSRLSQLVHRLRTKLDDHDHDPKYIETRPGFGFSAVPQNVERIRGGEG